MWDQAHNVAAMIVPGIIRILFITLPMGRIRGRIEKLTIEAMTRYASGGADPSEDLSRIHALEQRYKGRNKKVNNILNACIILSITIFISLGVYFGYSIKFIMEEKRYLDLTLLNTVNICGVFLAAAMAYFWGADGYKRLPDINYVYQFQSFIARQQERERLLREQQENERRRQYQEEQERQRRSYSYSQTNSAQSGLTDIYPELRALFGLPAPFTRAQLDLARRKLALKLHPDRVPARHHRKKRKNEEELKRINAAYEKLKPYAQ